MSQGVATMSKSVEPESPGGNPVIVATWQLIDDFAFVGCLLYARWSAVRVGGTAPFGMVGDPPSWNIFSGAIEFWGLLAIFALLKGFTLSPALASSGVTSKTARIWQIWSWCRDMVLRWLDDAILLILMILTIYIVRTLGKSVPLSYSWESLGFFVNHPRFWEQLLLAGTIKSTISRGFPRG